MNSFATLRRFVIVFLALASFSDARGVTVEAYTQARTDLSLAMTVSGRATELLVREGEMVEKGQVILKIGDAEGEAQIRLLALRAASSLEGDAALAEFELAKVREEMIRSASERGGASAFEVREVALERERSRLAYELFLQRGKEASLQLEQARRRHDEYTLVAPVDGVIELMTIELGETVEALEPVVRLVSADTLVALAQAPTTATLKLSVGTELAVMFVLGEERRSAVGVVAHLATIADAASDTRRVRVEIPNADGLPAGTRVLIEFPSE